MIEARSAQARAEDTAAAQLYAKCLREKWGLVDIVLGEHSPSGVYVIAAVGWGRRPIGIVAADLDDPFGTIDILAGWLAWLARLGGDA